MIQNRVIGTHNTYTSTLLALLLNSDNWGRKKPMFSWQPKRPLLLLKVMRAELFPQAVLSTRPEKTLLK